MVRAHLISASYHIAGRITVEADCLILIRSGIEPYLPSNREGSDRRRTRLFMR
ncbi:MAG: hypothetical protein ACXQTN_05670 [Methanoculleaceae archaeon]